VETTWYLAQSGNTAGGIEMTNDMTIDQVVEYFRNPHAWLLLTRGDVKALRKKISLLENIRLKVGKFPVMTERAKNAGWTYETVRAQVYLPNFRFPWSKK
jgi:hypothetical protein